ncbi:MAG TPA: sulfite exporter TauE/SafE family protein [Cyclobacteriaceae bacterium]
MMITALLLGLTGSLHCLGMCSPLVMAVTHHHPFLLNRVLYNLGRVSAYMVFGALAGSIGSLLDISGAQKIFSVLMGVILIVLGVTGSSQVRIPFLTRGLHSLTLLIKSKFSALLAVRNNTTMVAMGFLNGLLPCGLTYLAIAFCVALSVTEAILFMLIFGMATWPVMLGVPSLLSKFVQRLSVSFRQVTTVIMILTGTILLIRSYVVEQHHVPASKESITICK